MIQLSRRIRLPIFALLLAIAVPLGAVGVDEARDRIAELRDQIQQLQTELDLLLAERRGVPLEGEESVKPGINDSWKSPDIAPLKNRLEAESREIFQYREAIAAIVGPRPGAAVADIGAGSGFMAELFAEQVGESGRVYAVDINPEMMEDLAERAADKGIDHLETVVCSEKSVELPPATVDLMFICDTYHHFEYPRNTLSTIHAALRPGGHLVVVDFHRIPGVSRDWVLGHVRAGEEVFTQEIVDAGFELVNKHDFPSTIEENYILRFRKVGGAP